MDDDDEDDDVDDDVCNDVKTTDDVDRQRHDKSLTSSPSRLVDVTSSSPSPRQPCLPVEPAASSPSSTTTLRAAAATAAAAMPRDATPAGVVDVMPSPH